MACLHCPRAARAARRRHEHLADRYVKLVLAVGQHDDAFVDAYYGPPEWKTDATAAGKRPLADLGKEADGLAGELRFGASGARRGRPMRRCALRRDYLRRRCTRCPRASACCRVRALISTPSRASSTTRLRRPTTRDISPQALAKLERWLLAAGVWRIASRRFVSVWLFRATSSTSSQGRDRRVPRRTVAALALPRARSSSWSTSPEALERLQLVSGQVPQPFRSTPNCRSSSIARSISPAMKDPGHHVYNVLLESTS